MHAEPRPGPSPRLTSRPPSRSSDKFCATDRPGGSFVAECVADCHDDRSRPAPFLPSRWVRVEYDGESLVVGGRRKTVRNDAHAVNTLRKLDTDDAYFRQFDGR